MSGQVTLTGVFYMQVCVPCEWTDAEVVAFANYANPAGTSNGWVIRKEGDAALSGNPARVTCSQQPNRVHIMLDC